MSVRVNTLKRTAQKNMNDQILQLNKNLFVLKDYITVKGAKVLAVIANDLLAHALPMVPWDTGKLRRSGKAYVTIKGKNIIVGRTDKSSKYWNNVDAQIPIIPGSTVKGAKYIKANVTFNRRNEDGDDIALWAHENLLPWIPRPKPESARGEWYATKRFTGPKYLENALRLRADTYKKALENITDAHNMGLDLRAISRVTKRKRIHYEVDVVELMENKLIDLKINVGFPEGGARVIPLRAGDIVTGAPGSGKAK